MPKSLILVVETDPRTMGEICIALAAMRIRVSGVTNPVLAEAAFADERPAVAILDYEADGAGLPLAARLQAIARERGGDVSILLTASQDTPALQAAAARLNVCAILPRPVRVKTLAHALEAIWASPQTAVDVLRTA